MEKQLKGKALRRALKTKDVVRLTEDLPLITDTTEIITPEIANKMLEKNKSNRPINWNKVEEFSRMMTAGKWKFHGQGIILDKDGNLITGQKRLMAIIYSGIPQPMRISRGSPPDTANVIDRGISQSSRDLASRITERKHSPSEQSIIRAMCALKGNTKPSLDDIAIWMAKHTDILAMAIKETRRIKKTKSRLMMLAAICSMVPSQKEAIEFFARIEELSELLEQELFPIDANKCWNRGAAFTLAMEKAVKVLSNVLPCCE